MNQTTGRNTRLVHFLAFLALTLLALAGGTGALAQAAGVGRIQTVAGAVSLVRGASTTVVARGGVELLLGDTVRTGPNGRARVVTNDGKRATLGPNSSVTLGRPGRPGAWQVQAGRAAIWLTGKGRTEVSTPGAIAAAEGTGFEVTVAEDGTSTLTVAEGTVHYYNDQGRVVVSADQQSVARPGQAPSRPIAVDASGVLVFEGTVENLSLPIEVPRFFTPDPGRAQPFQTVLMAVEERRPDIAEPAIQLLTTSAPNSAEAALASGIFLLAQGRAAEAEPALTRAAAAASASPAGPTYLGVALFRQGKLQDAEASLREALRREEKDYAAHAYLSSVLLAEGKTAEAETNARRAVELEPGSPLAHEALGTVLLFSGRAREAVPELRQALQASPLSPSTHLQLAKALAAADQLEAAVREASQAVSMDPTNAAARSTLGILLMATKDVARAEREFRQALKLNPNLPAARTGLGAVAAQRGQFAKALDEQKAALDLDSGSIQARVNLGAALTARGALRDAVRELEAAVQSQPSYALAHANLAIAYLELQQYGKAVQEAQRAVQLGERSPYTHTTLARIYIRQRRFDRALAELRRTTAIDPSYPLQHFYLAQLYQLQGRDRDSLRALFRGITLDPGTMVEERMFARTEATVDGGENGVLDANAKTDGRAADGKLSYFVSGATLREDGPRRNDDDRLNFYEGILGYQPNPKHNLVLFTSLLDEHGGLPGQITKNAKKEETGVQYPLFRQDQSGTDLELMDRWQVARRSYLTLRGGWRRFSFLADDPDVDFLFRDWRNRESNPAAEARLDTALGPRDGLVTGVSFVNNQRNFNARAPLALGKGYGLFESSDAPDLLLGYLEWHHRFDDRTRALLGPYVASQSGLGQVLLPKFVGERELGDGSTLALLAYPTVQERNADLRPVETWARPFDIDRLGLNDQGWLMSYEATWQKPWSSGSILGVTGFYRRAHELLVPIVDPLRSPLVNRAAYPRAELMGGEVDYSHVLTSTLTASAFARYQQTNNLQGGDLPLFPEWASGIRLDYLDTQGWRSFIAMAYVGPRDLAGVVGSGSGDLGGFVTVDFRLEKQLSIKHSLFFEIRDLFDREPTFYYRFPTNGRTILGGIEIRL